jgi:Hint domain-containing protein
LPQINHYSGNQTLLSSFRAFVLANSAADEITQTDWRPFCKGELFKEEVSMSSLEDPNTGFPSSRRNLIRIGALVAAGIAAKTRWAAADDDFRRGDFDRDRRHDRDRDRHRDRDRDRDFHCFLKGTKIRTADGDRNIEDLAVGDLLPTVFAGTSPIQWIGRYRFKRSDPTKPWVEDVLPVRVGRSALGPDVPHADLYVTKPHALLIDGVLVAAGNLINGTTITRCDARELDELEFFHIKLAEHDVLYAEGAPCETLLNVDENAANFAEYLRQYGASTTEATLCAPLLRYGYRRGEIKSCFRSAISPWIDRRQTVDIIRDKLDARGIALSRQSELAS